MMARGKIAFSNFAAAAELEGDGWSEELPLTNMLQTDRFVSRPARYPRVWPLGELNPTFTVQLDRARVVDLVAFLFHNLSLSGRVRISHGLGAWSGSNWVEGEWIDAHRVVEPDDLDWLEPNFWAGELGEGALYPNHLFVPLDDVLADRFSIEIDDDADGGVHIDIGALWVTRCWTPAVNFERGRSPEVMPRDLTEEGPSGRLFSEVRRPRRRHDLVWKRLTDLEARQAFDMGQWAATRRPVLVIPDLDDPAATVREAFPAVFDPPPRPTFSYSGLNEVEAGFKEIIA